MLVLGLGSNIGDRLANLRNGLQHIRQIKNLTVVSVAPVYESDALMPENAPESWNQPYLNSAVKCETELSPEDLLIELKRIENTMGRDEGVRWAPRNIDIDILIWDERAIRRENLCVPHQELFARPFALWPLLDLVSLSKKEYDVARQWGSKFDGAAPFHTRQIAHRIDIPLMVGVLNVTPDSFSDGGKYINPVHAVEQAKQLFKAGADVIDIGAESTRPGAGGKATATPEEEWRRLQPVLQAIDTIWGNSNFRPKVSVDTRNAETAKKALAYNIDWLNDVSGFDGRVMREVAADSSVALLVMHSLGIPLVRGVVLDENRSAVDQVYSWGEKKIEQLTKAGIKKERIIFDPGIGFGKTADQSFQLIKNVNKFSSLNLPVLVGHSRKSFLNLFTDKDFSERDVETCVITNFLADQKVDYMRVHNVEFNMRALKIAKALL